MPRKPKAQERPQATPPDVALVSSEKPGGSHTVVFKLSPQMDLWERQPKEPSLWYDRFHAYLLLGSSRTLTGAWRRADLAGHLPEWSQASRLWQWKRRAEAYDEHLRIEDRAQFEEARSRSRAARIKTLEKFHDKIDNALGYLDPEEVSWQTISVSLKTVMDQLRADYDDLPTQRAQITNDPEQPFQFTMVIDGPQTVPRYNFDDEDEDKDEDDPDTSDDPLAAIEAFDMDATDWHFKDDEE